MENGQVSMGERGRMGELRRKGKLSSRQEGVRGVHLFIREQLRTIGKRDLREGGRRGEETNVKGCSISR